MPQDGFESEAKLFLCVRVAADADTQNGKRVADPTRDPAMLKESESPGGALTG